MSVSLNAAAYGTWFSPPTSTASMRSGVTISSRAPERAIISAADIAEWVPLSSKNSTSPDGVTSPPSTSQLVTSQLGAFLQLGQLRLTAGRHDHHVGLQRQ